MTEPGSASSIEAAAETNQVKTKVVTERNTAKKDQGEEKAVAWTGAKEKTKEKKDTSPGVEGIEIRPKVKTGASGSSVTDKKAEDRLSTGRGSAAKLKQSIPATTGAEQKSSAASEVEQTESKRKVKAEGPNKQTEVKESKGKTTEGTDVQTDGKKTRPERARGLNLPDIPEDLSSDVSSAPSLLDSTEELDTAQRDRLYEQATQYERRGKVAVALKCYLRCLRGLLDPTGFTYIPQCLHRIADIYYEEENFEGAIQFIQAEKMYYETALVDTSEIQQNIESKKRELSEEGSENIKGDKNADKTDILRAHEYEELARLCLRRKQPNLALEYQAKATKLRQDIYGENHSVTIGSLDYFAVVYAEVGKQQYSESMLKLGDEPLPTGTPALTKPVQAKKESDNKKRESSTERATRELTPEDEEWVSRSLLLVLFFICSVLLAILGSYLYCRIYEGTRTCVSWRSEIHYYYMRIKYFFYHYAGSYQKKYG